ncbi:MAG: tRNA (adenosine(37)-N6)-dimethylallyltransferase MiaA [Clostridiales bacterium]|nr:tRNA (adenosine(37)-N6)-dimethylallyltransferase MiaA [Clostridiales bacterium]
MKQKVIVIVGPTGIGKTKLSIELAKKIDGEIVSADSMQIYRKMNIGTAKPTEEEKQGIQHHMMDILDMGENFSVAEYQSMAFSCIEEILNRGKTPIVVGGTGLYINSIVDEIIYSETHENPEYRKKLEEIAKTKGNEILHKELKEKDPKAAERIEVNDLKRIVRALEVYEMTGKTITEQQENSKPKETKYDYIIIGLRTDREIIYDRINKRVDIMFEQGLLEEAKEILKSTDDSNTSHQAIGYKELAKYFEGTESLEEAKENIKKESRHYAKRQFTWFNRNERIVWLDSEVSVDENIERIRKIMNNA